jgi:hypothetical protein
MEFQYRNQTYKMDVEDYQRWGPASRFFTVKGYLKIIHEGRHRYVHRLILGIDDPKVLVDHISGDITNNKKDNLRLVTHKQNSMNHRMYRDNKSGHSGVHFVKRNKSKQWQASIGRKHIGTFWTKEEAIAARELAELHVFGEYKRV